MQNARWRWATVLLVVLVAGCVPVPAIDLPASFYSAFGGGRVTFAPQAPPAGVTGQEVVADLTALDPTFHGRAIPVFGIIDCNGDAGCQPGPGGTSGGPARAVWVVVYPDCNDGEFVNVPGVDIDVRWVVVDAVTGVDGGYTSNMSCPMGP